MQYAADRSLAVEAVRLASAVAVSSLGVGLRVSRKGGSPGDVVTQADVAAERAVLELLESRRPDDGYHRSGADTWSYASTPAAFDDLTDAITR